MLLLSGRLIVGQKYRLRLGTDLVGDFSQTSQPYYDLLSGMIKADHTLTYAQPLSSSSSSSSSSSLLVVPGLVSWPLPKLLLGWDQSDYYDPDMSVDDNGTMQEAWSYFCLDLDHILDEKSPNHLWSITGTGLGWQKLNIEIGQVHIEDSIDLIKRIHRPQGNDFRLDIYDQGQGLTMVSYSHDAPTGESWLLQPIGDRPTD